MIEFNLTDDKEDILNFMSDHEIIISKEMADKNIKAKFSKFGNRAGCRAIYEIIDMLDPNIKLKVINMMKIKNMTTKKYNNYD